ncbi:MAG: DNA mismatch repair protein MutS [Verrucomicrobiales bacterium]|jgi:DNA mismatch repair protein MutS
MVAAMAKPKANKGDSGKPKLTPMMQQYYAIRDKLPEDVLLFFRLGDFYEMFFEDAKRAAGLLNVALTKRNGIPMCGVPFHAAEGYIGKLVTQGKRVAIAEQTSEPQPGKIVERAVSQIISAGTISDLNLLDSESHNFLAAVYCAGKQMGLAYVDLTTGEFRVTECQDEEALNDEIVRVAPAETLISDEQVSTFTDVPGSLPYDGYTFLYEQALHLLKEHFKVQSLDGFGCGAMPAATSAAGAILHYLKFQLHRQADHIRRIQTYTSSDFVLIDAASQRNLDLVESRAGAANTLLKALSRIGTPMGARKLRDWILHPLRDVAELVSRQDLIAALLAEPFLFNQCQEQLKNVRDVERTIGRLSQGNGNARDLQALSLSLLQLPALRQHLETLNDAGQLATSLCPRMRDFSELVAMLEEALVDEPPVSIKEGGIFRDGYVPGLDELRAASTEGKQWIADLQVRESERTGIKSLKVKYNAVFGYFIEITKSNLANVPENYTRKQTTVNAERFITPELKEVEGKILGADERAQKLELQEFQKLRERVLVHLEDIQDSADALATLDVLCSLTETARLYHYCRPLLNESHNLYIKDGRHPVLDQNLAEEKFVPNDTHLEREQNRLLLITGPNMAGKSTYIRQVALITLMAQIGSFVPASAAEIGVVDRIFTRVGASDDIARGQSTFMVEMNETALIVNNASDRSLVILDEIGRGTSTFDGLSIAWSVAEHLYDRIGARTLFATHYHELTALSQKRPGVQNYNVAVREWNDQVIFLRKIVPGTADKSYGIQVARLAGLPAEIIDRAKEILEHLEQNSQSPEQESKLHRETSKSGKATSSSKSSGEENSDASANEVASTEEATMPEPPAQIQMTLFS